MARSPCPPAPASSTSADPTTGTAAAEPGNGVASLYITQAMPISASPARQTSPRTSDGSRAATVAATSAVSAPSPSSQARASVEKYAASGSDAVLTSDQANDAPVRTTSTARTQPAGQRAAPGQQHEHEQQRRPDQVELLLHRQRPVVLQRRGRLLLREVVGADGGEVDVGGEEHRPQRVLDHRRAGRPRSARSPRPRSVAIVTRVAAGQDPPRAAGVEAGDREPPGLLHLAEQQLGDQEPGDHEEHVDARRSRPAGTAPRRATR